MDEVWINPEVLKKLLENFTKITRIASVAVKPNGEPLTPNYGFCDYCNLIRSTEEGRKRCKNSDTKNLGLYRCHAGLFDGGSMISVEGQCLADIKYGQCTDEPLDEDFVRSLAREINVSEQDLVEASRHIQLSDIETLRSSIDMLNEVMEAYGDSISATKIQTEKELAVEKSNTKSAFLAQMSHEIRTPLNAIIGLAELGLDETTDQADKDYFEKIASSGKFLLGLINDVLDMSRIEQGKIELNEELTDGEKFLDTVYNIVLPMANKKNITIKADFSETKAKYVWMDIMRSQQIYINLLNNAIKFSEDGSVIEWKIIDELMDDHHMRMYCDITDYGVGMSEEFQKTLFQPFTQEHSKLSDIRTGSGLGLAIVKTLVEKMGGHITVKSKLGVGSTFSFDLYRRIEKEQPVKENVDANIELVDKDSLVLEGKRILLCEDHELNREIISKILAKKNIFVETAVNGAIGLELFAKSPQNYFDAILMDVRMPVMDGLEAVKIIRNLNRPDAKSVYIIALTADAFAEDQRKTSEVGMNMHLSKPIEPETLYEVLTKLWS